MLKSWNDCCEGDKGNAARSAQNCGAGAAPHPPAGHLSPYRDGEKDAVMDGFANFQRSRTSAEGAAISLLPVTIWGEGAGRR
ncbi:hypothetical protein EOB49_33255, partial [Mesorhizobium sp. M7A.F.Ca.MR.148.00.0.0]